MEVFLGPTSTIDVTSPPPSRLFQMDDGGAASVSSASSSSIGEPGDSDEEEVSSGNPLASLGDSLPSKKGLSNHFSGKSKSFANLSEASTAATAKDLEKVENPLNKRRRVLIACEWSRKSSLYGWHQNPKSMPLLALPDEERQQPSPPSDRDEERPVANGRVLHRTISKLQGRRSFKPASCCFALSDLLHLDDHHHHQISG